MFCLNKLPLETECCCKNSAYKRVVEILKDTESKRKDTQTAHTTKDSNIMQNIVVKVRADGEETMFKIKQGTKMRKIFSSYANVKGISLDSARFTLNGRTIGHDQTAAEVGLQNEDVIDCTVVDDSNNETTGNNEATVDNSDSGKITIGIKDQDGDITHFKINRTTKMKKVFVAYCNKK